MAKIPIEDEFIDILGKAQRGRGLSDEALAEIAGVDISKLRSVQSGEVDEDAIRNLAGALKLGAAALVESARQNWRPRDHAIPGLASFNSRYHDMTVNAYVVWDPSNREAAIFDTGADAHELLEFLKVQDLNPRWIGITHSHRDHIADLARLVSATRVPVFAPVKESVSRAEGFEASRKFSIGGLAVETRLTWGHSAGGISYVIEGLAARVAIVGDALFAGSMGGGLISYSEALETNRRQIFTLPDDTILCPGHGPLTSVGEEKAHNPFFPEFQN